MSGSPRTTTPRATTPPAAAAAAATEDTVSFVLNGAPVEIPLDEAVRYRTAEYLRACTTYRGTKIGCAQGGCGACTVAVTRPGASKPVSVASCLVPLPSLHGCVVTTSEGLAQLGGAAKAHPVQARLAGLNGSQCGYCSPGMAMQIFAALAGTEGGSKVRESELEQLLNGNICRCTGYRPIVDTLKSFAFDTTVTDNLGAVQLGPYDPSVDEPLYRPAPEVPALSSEVWSQPRTVSGAINLFSCGKTPVAGHTSPGIYQSIFSTDPAKWFSSGVVDLTQVPELSEISTTATSMQIGAAATWTKLGEALKKAVADRPALGSLLSAFEERVSTIAGQQVRNSGTVGGNLHMTRTRGFASDLAPILLALDAKIDVHTGKASGKRSSMELAEYLRIPADQPALVIGVSIALPADAATAGRSHGLPYRVAMRSHNSYALAALAAVVELAEDRARGGVRSARIAVGAVPFVGKPFRMTATEAAMQTGAGWEKMWEAVQAAMDKDFEQLGAPVDSYYKHGGAKDGSGVGDRPTTYQLSLIRGFVHKVAVEVGGDSVPPAERTATHCMHDAPRRSTSHQTWAKQEDDSFSPVFEPINKTTAVGQATGDCKFCDDQHFQGLQAAFVHCPVANAVVSEVDSSAAKEAFGDKLVAVLRAHDLPANEVPFSKVDDFPCPPDLVPEAQSWLDEIILVPEGAASQYAGQPVAIVLVRGTASEAQRAAAHVTVRTAVAGPVAAHPNDELAVSVYDTPEGIFRGHRRGRPNEVLAAVLAGERPGLRIVQGGLNRRSQSHWYMETQTCIVTPDEYDGMSIVLAAQSTDNPQRMVCKMLGIPQHKVKLDYRRVGGGFGGKLTRTMPVLCAAAAAAKVMREPVRLVLPRSTDLQVCGGRQELGGNWQAAVTAAGQIEALRLYIRVGQGHSADFGRIVCSMLAGTCDQNYAIPHMEVATQLLRTHAPARSSVRAPGHFEATTLAETVIDGVAAQLGMHSVDVREKNFIVGGSWNLGGGIIPVGPVHDYSHLELWRLLKERSKFDERRQRIVEFNRGSRWVKRGVSITPARYGMMRFSGMTARIQVYRDSSILVNIAGSEIGQGLHTKVAQVVARQLTSLLGVPVPMESVHFADASSHAMANAVITGGSTTSEAACFAAEDACTKLAATLKAAAKNKQKWKEVVDESFSEKILGLLPVPPHLEAAGYFRSPLQDFAYETFGGAMAEVEVDALTGESRIVACHVLFDAGPSLNPAIDMGQIEGAFIMGIGNMLAEGVILDPDTGACLSDNTWTYKVPIASDIPESFVVELVDLAGKRVNTAAGNMQHRMLAAMSAVGLAGKVNSGVRKYRSSKATGEPPVLLSLCVHSAVHEAVTDFRKEGGAASAYVLPIPAPPPVLHGVIAGSADFAAPEFPYPPQPEEPEQRAGAGRVVGCAVLGAGAVAAAFAFARGKKE